MKGFYHFKTALKTHPIIQKYSCRSSCNIFKISFTKSQKTGNRKKMCVITFKPIEVPTHSTSQNDCLNLSFVKDTYVDGREVSRNGRKTAI